MNWFGDLIQENIEETDTVLDLGCGIMQCTLDFVPTYPDTRLKCKKLVGVDVYKPYLDFLREKNIETILWDLRNAPYPFEDNSFDVVLLSDILEHLTSLKEVKGLIEESKRIARKKIFAITPSKFFSNKSTVIEPPSPYNKFGSNEFQEHHLLIDKDFLRKNGFKILRMGRHRIGVIYIEKGNFNKIRKRILILRISDFYKKIRLMIKRSIKNE